MLHVVLSILKMRLLEDSQLEQHMLSFSRQTPKKPARRTAQTPEATIKMPLMYVLRLILNSPFVVRVLKAAISNASAAIVFKSESDVSLFPISIRSNVFSTPELL